MSEKETTVMIGLEIHAYLDTKSKLFCSCPTSSFSVPWVKDYLNDKKVKFDFVEHEAVTRPIDSARVRGVKVSQIAKALVYVADKKPVLFILAGDRKLDEQKAIGVLNAKDLRMATKEEVKEFTGCVVGLVPPTIEGITKILDEPLMKNEVVSFNAGTQTAGIKINIKDLLNVLDNYQIANFSLDELIEEVSGGKAKIHEIESEPNSLCCPTCLGWPGAKPVLNEKAIEHAVKVGFALNCNINEDFFFSRKTYFYPDMAMNYQITQYEVPVAENGFVFLPSGKKIGIKRAHVEWDPAALVHPDGMGKSSYVLIDYNRSGLPLIEIVTQPDLTTPQEAREFMNTLENILNYLHVLKPDTTLKVDCNVSINGGKRAEVKNVSGFAAAEKALSYEIARQKQEVKMGRVIEQSTRAFNADTGTTVELRKKETEEDYGYIFDPDLVKVSLSKDFLIKVKAELPELPEQKAKRLVSQLKLAEYDAKVICSDFELGNLFDEVVKDKGNPVITARLLTREVLAVLNHDALTWSDVKVNPKHLLELVQLVDAGKVSDKNTKQAIINYIGAQGDKSSPKQFLEKNNLLISQSINLDEVITKVIAANEKAVANYKSGNEKTFNFISGLVMRETKGTVSPQKVQEALKQKLG
jgi:aspartyl-tRNA(Asn)/glutamyl-tRNA(Gln) amidotransferase subunit B